MKTAAFIASSPFEIGDLVKFRNYDKLCLITDIACTHYCKTGEVKFTYELDYSGKYEEIKVSDEIGNIAFARETGK